MIGRGIVRRYVRALFELALESKQHQKVDEGLKWFQSLLDADPQLGKFLADPRVSVADKRKAVSNMVTDDLPELVADFLKWVVEHGRAEILPVVSNEYEAMLRKQQGVALVEVTSAVELDSKTEKELKSSLEKGRGGSVELSTQVDPDILGGLRIRIGSDLYDGSLRRRLEEVRQQMLKAPMPGVEAMAGSEAPEEQVPEVPGDDPAGD